MFHTGETFRVRNSFGTHYVYHTGESSREGSPFYDHYVNHTGKSLRVILATRLTQVSTSLTFFSLVALAIS